MGPVLLLLLRGKTSVCGSSVVVAVEREDLCAW